MKLPHIALAAITLASLAACDARVSTPEPKSLHLMVSSLAYAQDDRTGICYSFLSAAHPGDVNDASVTHASVPCEKIPPSLLKH